MEITPDEKNDLISRLADKIDYAIRKGRISTYDDLVKVIEENFDPVPNGEED